MSLTPQGERTFSQPASGLSSFLVSPGPSERGLRTALQHLPQTAENQDGVSHQGEHHPVGHNKERVMAHADESDGNVTVQDRGWQSCPSAVTPQGPLFCHGCVLHVPGCQGPSLAWIKSGPRTNTSGMDSFVVDQGCVEAPGLGVGGATSWGARPLPGIRDGQRWKRLWGSGVGRACGGHAVPHRRSSSCPSPALPW